MKVNPRIITRWGTDEVLDFLSDKPYKNETIEILSKSDGLHLAKTHQLADVPIYILLGRTQEGELIGVASNKYTLTCFVFSMVEQGIMPIEQYALFLKGLQEV